MRAQIHCNMIMKTGAMGMGVSYCRGCAMLKKAEVLESPAGYYVGVLDVGPVCRITEYMRKDEAELYLEIIQPIMEVV